MDDRFDKEEYSNTRYPRRETRQSLNFGSDHKRIARGEEPVQTSSERGRFLDEVKHEPEEKELYRESRTVRENRMNSNRKHKNRRRKKRHLTGFAKSLIVLVLALIITIAIPVVCLSDMKLFPLVPICAFSVVAQLNSSLFYGIFEKLMPKNTEEQAMDNSEEEKQEEI